MTLFDAGQLRLTVPLKSAVLSDDGAYRYWLSRQWEPVDHASQRVCWVMLNPSTADADVDDPTIRRCIAFSKGWGFRELTVVNAFALRATDPRALATHPDPAGPLCDEWINRAMRNAAQTVVAWGASWPAAQHRRMAWIAALTADRAVSLGVTASGQPRHPLYLPKTAERRPW